MRSKVKTDARCTAKRLNHRLGTWVRGWYPFDWQARCQRCGMLVSLVRTHETPAILTAEGEAVEQPCDGVR